MSKVDEEAWAAFEERHPRSADGPIFRACRREFKAGYESGYEAGYKAHATHTEDTDTTAEQPPTGNVRPRTIVEFKDNPYSGEDIYPHKAMRVFINGQEVLVERDSIFLDFGDDQVTTVQLTLQPSEVHFHNKERK